MAERGECRERVARPREYSGGTQHSRTTFVRASPARSHHSWLALTLNPSGEVLSQAERDHLGAITKTFLRRNGFAHPSAVNMAIGVNFLKGWATIAWLQDVSPALTKLRAQRLAAAAAAAVPAT